MPLLKYGESMETNRKCSKKIILFQPIPGEFYFIVESVNPSNAAQVWDCALKCPNAVRCYAISRTRDDSKVGNDFFPVPWAIMILFVRRWFSIWSIDMEKTRGTSSVPIRLNVKGPFTAPGGSPWFNAWASSLRDISTGHIQAPWVWLDAALLAQHTWNPFYNIVKWWQRRLIIIGIQRNNISWPSGQ